MTCINKSNYELDLHAAVMFYCYFDASPDHMSTYIQSVSDVFPSALQRVTCSCSFGYRASVLFGHEEAGKWVTVTGLSLAGRPAGS
jgi:hypothetical protein